jgi:hypothetical protein
MFTPEKVVREKKPEQADEVMKKEKSPFKGIPLGRAEKGVWNSKRVPLSKENIEKAGREAERENMRKEMERLRQKPSKDAEKRLEGGEAGATEETSEKKGLRERVMGGITTLAEKLGNLRIVKDKTANFDIKEGLSGAVIVGALAALVGAFSDTSLASFPNLQLAVIYGAVGAAIGFVLWGIVGEIEESKDPY